MVSRKQKVKLEATDHNWFPTASLYSIRTKKRREKSNKGLKDSFSLENSLVLITLTFHVPLNEMV